MISNEDKIVGWETPRQKAAQRTLFPESCQEVLARLNITHAEALAWYERAWISFDIRTICEIDEPELREITFINMLANSFIKEVQIDGMLAQLPAPYRYDYRSMAYHFCYGWVSPRPEVEVSFEENFDNWLEELLSDKNVTELWAVIEKAQAAIQDIQQDDEDE